MPDRKGTISRRASVAARRLTVLLAAALLACGDDRGAVEAEESAGYAMPDAAYAPGAGQAASPGADRDQAEPTARPRLLVRTGSATVEVEELDAAVEAVRVLAERAGGMLASVAISGGRNEMRSATMLLRVPSDRFDETIAALDSLGEVESVHIDSEDVGEAYADLEVRIANARRLEQRLLDLLATRTGSLEDVLAVERELARVREEIERMEAQMRSMRDRVELSTISLALHEPEPLFSTGTGDNVIVRSFRQAGRNFIGFVAGLIASLGVVLPLLVLLGAGWWAWRRVRRRRRPRAE